MRFVFLQVCTPCNTPATPPNFPDALIAFSRMSTSDKQPPAPTGRAFNFLNHVLFQLWLVVIFLLKKSYRMDLI